MRIIKAGKAGASGLDPRQEIEAVNRFAKAELSPEEAYVFSVALCDNEVDRDFEKFSMESIEELSGLFVGVSGIFDHEWKAANQTARLYRTEVVRDKAAKNSLGEDYCVLKGYAYMLRSEKNAELISEIEAGIKKETSIGCSVTKRVCSICGEEMRSGGCGHIPGREYDGKLCFAELFNAVDAYEWSFVAVPAQKGAGVMKKMGRADTLKGFVESGEGAAFAREYCALEKDAALGREYRDALRKEVLRLGLLCDEGLFRALESSSGFMDAAELKGLRDAFEKRLEDSFPVETQLPGRGETVSFAGDEYII